MTRIADPLGLEPDLHTLKTLMKRNDWGEWKWDFSRTSQQSSQGLVADEVVREIEKPGGITKEAQSGTGKLAWYKQTWEQNPSQCHIINGLADLPVVEMRGARVTKSGTSLETQTRTVRAMY